MLDTACSDSQQRAIDKFRLHLAAAGYRAYLLSDDEVWQWLTRLIADLECHVESKRAFDGTDLRDIEHKAIAFGESRR